MSKLLTFGILQQNYKDSFVLNKYETSACGYSVRKIDNNYSGYCLKVRRSSDDAELDIGFNNEEIDESSINSFVGNGDGYISVWYDQSGNSRNLKQIDKTKQPKIIISGNIVTVNERFSILFETGQFLRADYFYAFSVGYHVQAVAKVRNNLENNGLISKTQTNYPAPIDYYSGTLTIYPASGNNVSCTTANSFTNSLPLHTRAYTAPLGRIWINGKLDGAGTKTDYYSSDLGTLSLGVRNDGGVKFDGYCSEVFIYPKQISDYYRKKINRNQMIYYKLF